MENDTLPPAEAPPLSEAGPWQWTKTRCRALWEAALSALERAEKRVGDNFRVPPHGG